MDERTVIEVNGVKLEVDLRTAKRVDTMRVGDRVRVLIKKPYSAEVGVYSGTVIGFEPFPSLPTIIVAYMETSFTEASLKFAYINAKSEGIELVASIDDDQLALDKDDILAKMENEIENRRAALDEAERKRDFFLKHFEMYWQQGVSAH